MKPTEKTAAVTQRASVAAETWGLYFSEMPYRMTSPRSLQDSAAAMIRPAENDTVFSAIDVSATDHRPENEYV
jgi:hypothetical protein